MTATFLVTRPASQGQTLCKALQQCGFIAQHIPVMEIEALEDAPSTARMEACFSQLAQYHGIILVSLNAAEQALLWFARLQVQPTQPLFTVGKTTAQFLQQSTLFTTQPIVYPHKRMDSEGLLALPALQESQVKNKRFLLLRGEGGRELIASTLIDRGAIVDSCPLYRRFVPEKHGAALQAWAVEADGFIINSAESLDNFLLLTKPITLCDKTIVVPSERVASAARQAGFQHIIVAANATDDAIVKAIQGVFQPDSRIARD